MQELHFIDIWMVFFWLRSYFPVNGINLQQTFTNTTKYTGSNNVYNTVDFYAKKGDWKDASLWQP